ncbi:hypothetical protein GCM10009765_28350 [Fodinicola feengrottensis]|uniref:DUF2339 domain-containing protein n=1 Tax=Fodinicola feengrottensis TaxID=435914 RepID=A0ABN2GV86_9ACTN
MSVVRRLVPVLVLFLLAPFVAEYVLGNIPPSRLFLLPMMALLYGTGAVLIREVTRRTGRGWPTIVLLGLAYAVIEEGIATQSLFNPNYVGLHLLAYGFVPALGIAGPWTAYMLGLHTAWSISVPLLLTETMFRHRGSQPWLGRVGLVVIGVLFVLGVSLTAVFSIKLSADHFLASPAQLVAAGSVAAVLVVLAFMLFRPTAARTTQPDAARTAPSPWLVGVTTFVAGSIFHALIRFGGQYGVPAAIEVLLNVVLAVALVALILWWSRAAGWSQVHKFAAAAGGVLVYGWVGYLLINQQGLGETLGWAALVVFMVALLAGIGLGLRKDARQAVADPVDNAILSQH